MHFMLALMRVGGNDRVAYRVAYGVALGQGQGYSSVCTGVELFFTLRWVRSPAIVTLAPQAVF